MGSRSAVVLASLVLLGGCFLESTPFATDGDDAGISLLDGGARDSGGDEDAGANGTDAGRDAGTDAGTDAGIDACMPSAEMCDGLDNDCDGTIADDGEAEPGFGEACDGPDDDECDEGTRTCVGGTFACDDATSTTVDDDCDGVDDDCDGTIDSDAACPCTFDTFGGHSYLFCDTGGDRRSWSSARGSCPMGYELVHIGSSEEQEFIEEKVVATDRDFWIGGRYDEEEDRFEWVADHTPVPSRGGTGYQNWGGGLPDGSGDCMEMDGDGSNGDGGDWNDAACDDGQRYICESVP